MYQNISPDPNPSQYTIDMLEESIIFKERQLQLLQWLIDQVTISETYQTPELSPTQAKDVIGLLQFIRDQKLIHSNILYNMYTRLTNASPPPYEGYFSPPENILSGLEMAILENLESAQENRLLMNGLQEQSYKFLISSIISDEINYANLLSYITFSLKNPQIQV
nr:hypothetical protein [Clostridioides sp.]